MGFHVTSFFVFGAKSPFGCPSVTHLSPTLPVLYARGAVGTVARILASQFLRSSASLNTQPVILR